MELLIYVNQSIGQLLIFTMEDKDKNTSFYDSMDLDDDVIYDYLALGLRMPLNEKERDLQVLD